MLEVNCPRFDEEKYALGELCKFAHEHGATGQSLRYFYRDGIKGCIECARLRAKDWALRNPERNKELSEQSRERTRDKRLQKRRERYAKKKPERQLVAEAKKRIEQKERELFGIQMQFLNSQLSIDTDFYTLGRLCKHGHEYEETGFSLRYVRDMNQCTVCRKISRDKNIARKTYRVRKRNAQTHPYTFADLRASLLNFDFKCAYCEKDLLFDTKLVAHDDYLNWDHVHPISKGGVDAIYNLLPACRICNLSKSTRLFEVWYSESNPIFTAVRFERIQTFLKSRGLNS